MSDLAGRGLDVMAVTVEMLGSNNGRTGIADLDARLDELATDDPGARC